MPLSEEDRLYISALVQDTSKGHRARINKIKEVTAGDDARQAEMIEGLAHAYATLYVQKKMAGESVVYFFGTYQIPEDFKKRVEAHIPIIMIAKAAGEGGRRKMDNVHFSSKRRRSRRRARSTKRRHRRR
jgi:hypothetical protein